MGFPGPKVQECPERLLSSVSGHTEKQDLYARIDPKRTFTVLPNILARLTFETGKPCSTGGVHIQSGLPYIPGYL